MPTTRAKLALKNLGDSRSDAEALVKANYKPSYARSGQIKKTKGWIELTEKFLSDKQLAAVHQKLLNKKESIVVSDGAREGSHIEFTEQPHSDAAKALDMAYKLKRKYPKEGENNLGVVILNISGETVKKYGQEDSTPQSPSTNS